MLPIVLLGVSEFYPGRWSRTRPTAHETSCGTATSPRGRNCQLMVDAQDGEPQCRCRLARAAPLRGELSGIFAHSKMAPPLRQVVCRMLSPFIRHFRRGGAGHGLRSGVGLVGDAAFLCGHTPPRNGRRRARRVVRWLRQLAGCAGDVDEALRHWEPASSTLGPRFVPARGYRQQIVKS